MESRWKLRTLLRATRFFTTEEQVLHYKSRILSFVEYRTPGIYHACQSVLDRLDAVQRSFLKEVGLTEEDALLRHNLAPLEARRDIALLGVSHRAVLREGLTQLHQFFRVQVPLPDAYGTRLGCRRHRKQLVDVRSSDQLDVLSRSGHGLVAVYNLLPADLVELGSVSAFQAVLQFIIKDRAAHGVAGWARMFSPRVRISQHPLRMYRWDPALLLPLTSGRHRARG